MAHGLSKSKLMSFRQCPKRLWLEKHRPDLGGFDAETQARFAEGHEVGAIAQRLYDTGGGVLVEYGDDLSGAVERTQQVLKGSPSVPVFEATFVRNGLLVRADVLLRGADGPKLIEVKASGSVKPQHVEDCAVQSWVLDTTPARPRAVALAHVDSSFVYPGDGDYAGLLAEVDLTVEATRLRAEVPDWVLAAKRVLSRDEPEAAIGRRCSTPYDCPFMAYCWKDTEYPIANLPGVNSRLDELLAAGYHDVREVPEPMVRGAQQLRVWRAVRDGRATLAAEAREAFSGLGWPRCYLDFETAGGAVPRWAGTRPWQQLPFQFSLHVEHADGRLEHAEFLDTSGGHPARAVAKALIEACGEAGPVFMYTPFERGCINTLGQFCPDLREQLEAIAARLVDLHPIARQHYYHPAMQGSWSIKKLLPAIAPEMDYSTLGEVQEGGAAQRAWAEATNPATGEARRAEIRAALLAYCRHDTLAMVTVARFLEGR